VTQRVAIPAFDLQLQYRALKDELHAALSAVLESGEFILGPAVKALENRIAPYCDCTHAVGVASGTDALRLALTAVGVGPGSEVITTPFSFIATGNSISHCGARPVFVDIDPATYTIDPDAVAAAITPRTRALLPVHLYGLPADMTRLVPLAEKHNLVIIEDCAQAIGATFQGRKVGSFGAAGCLSFYPTKNLGAYGDGGMVVSTRADVAEKVDVLRRHGSKKKYHADLLGFNSRLDSIQAAILGVKLNYLDRWTTQRRELAQRYNALLAGLPVTLPVEAPGSVHVYHQYTIRAPRRDELAAYLKEQGIGTMIYYPVPMHRQSLYAELDYREGSLPESEKASREVLSLPMFPELTEEQQAAVAEAIRAFYRA
jgi:dTDP-4-amino-4,6-dideoxygalactose transaminase